MKMKAMLSQPMNGKTKEEIATTRERAIATLESMGYEVVNTLFTDEWYSPDSCEARGVVNRPMMFLAKSLENMSLCHVAYFCKGWKNARGCRIEHAVAEAYGLTVLYEEGDE
uniref:Blasticidin M n=1 Tax=Siphoviridae sp. ct9lR64 TaxID=2826178 RepID=A0A8S5QYW5_9CAUD|nr:MAG TPA: Blasticidin M [Siphoviridae sp. ct9lR64]